MDWSVLSNPWFTPPKTTVEALKRFDPILGRRPAEDDNTQWNFLLTVWSAYAKSVHAMANVNRYDLWVTTPPQRPSEERLKHIALWGTLDNATMSMHSALDNLAHAVYLLQNPDSSKDCRPPSFVHLFDKTGTLKSKWGAPSELAILLRRLYHEGGKRTADDNNRSKHRRSAIPQPNHLSGILSLPFYSPSIDQPESRLFSDWHGELKSVLETVLPLFWESLSQVVNAWYQLHESTQPTAFFGNAQCSPDL